MTTTTTNVRQQGRLLQHVVNSLVTDSQYELSDTHYLSSKIGKSKRITMIIRNGSVTLTYKGTPVWLKTSRHALGRFLLSDFVSYQYAAEALEIIREDFPLQFLAACSVDQAE